jgi:hypothetical protein
VQKHIKKLTNGGGLNNPGCDGLTIALESDCGGQRIVIWVRSGGELSDMQSVIAHEVHHAVFEVLSSRGVRSKEIMGEAGAYLSGFYVKEIMRRINKPKKAKKNAKARTH